MGRSARFRNRHTFRSTSLGGGQVMFTIAPVEPISQSRATIEPSRALANLRSAIPSLLTYPSFLSLCVRRAPPDRYRPPRALPRHPKAEHFGEPIPRRTQMIFAYSPARPRTSGPDDIAQHSACRKCRQTVLGNLRPLLFYTPPFAVARRIPRYTFRRSGPSDDTA